MPPALTPALALDYVRELSADVRAAIVLDGAGVLLAGPAELVEPARGLLTAGGDAAELEAVSAGGVVCAVRSADHAAIAVCGRFAIPAIVRHDLRAAIAALEGRAPGSGPPAAAQAGRPPPPAAREPGAGAAHDGLERAVEALISAVQRGFEA